MALLRPIETIESRLSEIPIKIGQIIFCTDTNDIYMDNSENERTHMTDIIKLKTENDRESLFVPLIGKIYLVEETNILYKYNGLDWETISIDISINMDSISYENLVPGTLQKKGQGYAPRTLGSVVYLEDGKTVNEVIAELKKDKTPILKSLRNTVKISTDVDTVPIGILEFNKDTDILFVYVNSTYLEQIQDYTIENNNIKSVSGLWNGSEEIQIFNFVVLKLIIPEDILVSENRTKLQENSNELIDSNILNTSNDTINILLDKISILESQMQNLLQNNTNIISSENTKNNLNSLTERVACLEEMMDTIISQDTAIRIQNAESCIISLQERISNLEMR